jgi:hypothetical protein
VLPPGIVLLMGLSVVVVVRMRLGIAALAAGRPTGLVREPATRPEGRQDLFFQVPCARPAEVLSRIIAEVNAPDNAPSRDGIYLRKCGFDHVVFGYGSREQDQFLAAVAVGSQDVWCKGRFTLLTWLEKDGQIVAGEQLSDLYDRIEHAVLSMGGVASAVA